MNSNSQHLKSNTEALKKIKHVVVLMMENRSFDNMLGWLYDGQQPPRGQSFDGLHDSLWNPLDNIDSDGNPFIEKVYIARNEGTRKIGRKEPKFSADFTLPNPDPGEGYKDTNHQLFGVYTVDNLFPPEPTNMGFVNNYQNAMLYSALTFGETPTNPRDIMICYTPKQVPVISTLAKNYAVCDAWFASVPSQTLPNRDFVHAATSTGFVNNKPNGPCDARTIFNVIQDLIDDGRDDLSWRVYSGTQEKKTKTSDDWIPFSLTRVIMSQLHDYKFDGNFKEMHEFYTDAEAGNLPSYCFLEPQLTGVFQNDQHPSKDIRAGERLLADVYHAVLNSPNWEETLLVITYDEHGGCYDHVAPPGKAKTPIEGAGQMGFRFNRFGVRVPTLLISPYIEAGTIARPEGWTPYDHTSIIATLRNTFNLGNSLTARDHAAPDLSGVLTLSEPRSDKVKLDNVPDYTPRIEDALEENDLQRQIAETLEAITPYPRKAKHSLHHYIHETYRKHFVKKNAL